MTNTVNITTLLDAKRHAIVHVYIKSDGVEGEVVDQIIIDPATLVPPQAAVAKFDIEEIWWDFTGFGVRFEFNSIPDYPIWTCNEQGSYVDMRSFGGLKDRSGMDGSGALQITTFGLDSANDQGTFVIKIRK